MRPTSSARRLNQEKATANRPIEARWEKRDYDNHRRRLREMKPAVTSGWGPKRQPPPFYSHIADNPKKALQEDVRYATIEYENSLLLGKMRRIMQLGTAATNPGVFSPAEVAPRSLNEGWRRRELERITNDNQGIVRRIQHSTPSYAKTSWEARGREKAALLDRISRFRPPSPGGSLYGGSSYDTLSPDRYDPLGVDYLSGADVMERLKTAPAASSSRLSSPGGGRRPQQQQLRPLSRERPALQPRALASSSFPPYGSLGGSMLVSAGSCGSSSFAAAAAASAPRDEQHPPPPPRCDTDTAGSAASGSGRSSGSDTAVKLQWLKQEDEDWSSGPWVKLELETRDHLARDDDQPPQDY